MFSGRSLATKMTVFILGGVLLVLAVILGDMYLSFRSALILEARQNAQNLASSVARKIETELRALAKIPENLAIFLENGGTDQDTLLRTLRQAVERNKELFGSTAAFAPYGFDSRHPSFSPYFYKSNQGVQFTQLGDQGYDYFKWDWYKIPQATEQNVWSEPYFDEGGGNILMCTYSVPFFMGTVGDKKTIFQGVVTGDISLEWLTGLIADASRDVHSGFGFLLSPRGAFISHPDKDFILKQSIYSLSRQTGNLEMEDLGRAMTGGDAGVIRLERAVDGRPAYCAFSPISSTGWSLAVVFPEETLLKILNDLNHRAALVAAVGVVLLFLVILFISRSVAGPIRKMVDAAGQVAAGNLDIDLTSIRSRDEVGRMAQAFAAMATDLKDHIRQLTEATAVKERIESELNIAAQIQKSILPSIFPPFPERDEFDLFATMTPAREVGGDYYDFFFVDDGRLALVMADVSGKGVPAALFMMISRTLIKSIASEGKTPAETLAKANDILCQGNEAAMFVTVFLAFYDCDTGKLTYANGGHNPALVFGPDGSCRNFGAKTGTALGFMPDLPYRDGEYELNPGDRLVLYTDGVTEATAPDKCMFGEERLCRFLTERIETPLPETCRALEAELDRFQQGVQFDDITVLMLRRKI